MIPPAALPMALLLAVPVQAPRVQVEDPVVGTGKAAAPGLRCTVHYTGWLWWGNRRGPRFDASREGGGPVTFRLGRGEVIRGWDEGLAGMREGGRRVLIVPPELAYGSRGAGNGLIPPDTALCFELELLKVQ